MKNILCQYFVWKKKIVICLQSIKQHTVTQIMSIPMCEIINNSENVYKKVSRPKLLKNIEEIMTIA